MMIITPIIISHQKNYYRNTSKGELFYFDPNTASADDWKRLGLRDKTICHYTKLLK